MALRNESDSIRNKLYRERNQSPCERNKTQLQSNQLYPKYQLKLYVLFTIFNSSAPCNNPVHNNRDNA